MRITCTPSPVGEHEQLAAARPHLVQVALQLLEQGVVRRNGDHRHLRGHQGERAVLQLAGGVGLGVDIADLLQLQRAFERDRVMHAAAEEERVLLPREFFAPGNDLWLEREHAAHRQRQVAQRLQVRRLVGLAQVAARLRRNRPTSCVVKAFVDATPISTPARVRYVSAHSRTMALVATLQIVRVWGMPSSRACFTAASVSAVSPLWVIVTTRVRGFGTLSR